MKRDQEILLLRHGQTPGNALRQYIGVTDEHLSPEGIAQLSALAYPPADTVYVSPMLRCRETAALLFPGAELISVEGLQEMDFGCFEGRSFLDMEHDPDYRAWVDSGCESPVPGGEDKAGFTDRCCAAFLSVLDSSDAETLTFVVHGGTIMSVLSRFAVPARGYYGWFTPNGHGFRLRRRPDSRTLELIGEV